MLWAQPGEAAALGAQQQHNGPLPTCGSGARVYLHPQNGVSVSQSVDKRVLVPARVADDGRLVDVEQADGIPRDVDGRTRLRSCSLACWNWSSHSFLVFLMSCSHYVNAQAAPVQTAGCTYVADQLERDLVLENELRELHIHRGRLVQQLCKPRNNQYSTVHGDDRRKSLRTSVLPSRIDFAGNPSSRGESAKTGFSSFSRALSTCLSLSLSRFSRAFSLFPRATLVRAVPTASTPCLHSPPAPSYACSRWVWRQRS